MLVFAASSFAQYARLIVFTENGDRFFLYINGKLQNASLQSNVTTKKISEQGVTMRVVFDKEGLGEKLFKIPVKPGYELTCALKFNNKGEYVIRYAGEAPLEEEPINEPEPQQSARKVPSTQPNDNTDQENVDININMGIGGTGVNSNVKYTQKVSSSSTSSSTYSQPQAQTASEPKVISCPAMDNASFAEAKKSVAAKGFDETRITESKQILDGNCMSAKQVKELLTVFGFDESRLDVAKYAYKRCSDSNNYFMVNSSFQFESSIEELNTYIKSVK